MMVLRVACLLIWVGLCGFASSPEDLKGEPVTLAQSYTLPSEILGQTRRINVYVPPGYATSKAAYPVLFLLDGGVQEDFIHIMGIASLAADFRQIREFILVGIEGIDRRHDMMSPSSVKKDLEIAPTSGNAAHFRRFLEKELKPFVAKHWRLTDESVLMGESAAGFFVVETFLLQPELFQGYIAVSPSVWWNDMALVKASATHLQKQPYPANRRLYLTIANEGEDMKKGGELLVDALGKHAPKDLKWTFTPMLQEHHGSTFHPSALAAVRLFFATPPEKKK